MGLIRTEQSRPLQREAPVSTHLVYHDTLVSCSTTIPKCPRESKPKAERKQVKEGPRTIKKRRVLRNSWQLRTNSRTHGKTVVASPWNYLPIRRNFCQLNPPHLHLQTRSVDPVTRAPNFMHLALPDEPQTCEMFHEDPKS